MNSSPTRRLRFVKVDFAPSCGCLGSLVALVSDFCRSVVDDADIVFAFRMAAFELTENMVKYGCGDWATLEISVNNAVDGPELQLTAINQASAERIKDIHERLLEAEAAEDPIAHFDKLVRDTLNSPNESRLGLGRLRAEAALLLSHTITGNTVSICVRHRILKAATGDN
jgi:hypothetical protein